MKRQNLTDGTAQWFDLEKAQRFEEDTYWDGNNTISQATGSQWHHETMFRTAGGVFVLHYYSQWQGTQTTWLRQEPSIAHAWLLRNGHDEAVPAEYVAGMEI